MGARLFRRRARGHGLAKSRTQLHRLSRNLNTVPADAQAEDRTLTPYAGPPHRMRWARPGCRRWSPAVFSGNVEPTVRGPSVCAAVMSMCRAHTHGGVLVDVLRERHGGPTPGAWAWAGIGFERRSSSGRGPGASGGPAGNRSGQSRSESGIQEPWMPAGTRRDSWMAAISRSSAASSMSSSEESEPKYHFRVPPNPGQYWTYTLCRVPETGEVPTPSGNSALRWLEARVTTLYHRLQRIERVTGMNLRDGTDRLTLHLGFKLARISSSRGSPVPGARTPPADTRRSGPGRVGRLRRGVYAGSLPRYDDGGRDRLRGWCDVTVVGGKS